MAFNLNAIVNLSVNDGNADVLQKVKTFASGSVELFTSGRVELASGGTAVLLDHTAGVAGIKTARFFWMFCTDASAPHPAKTVILTHNDDTNATPTGDRVIYGGVAQAILTSPENADLGYILVTAQSDSTGTIIEYVIGGDKP